MYVRQLRNSEPPVIPPKRLDQFIKDVFYNFDELRAHHTRLVEALHEIQREEHPRIRSITEKVFDAALNFREAYMEYIPNYPIAAYRIDEEMANNHRFRTFVTVRTDPPTLSCLHKCINLNNDNSEYSPPSRRSQIGYEELHQPTHSALAGIRNVATENPDRDAHVPRGS